MRRTLLLIVMLPAVLIGVGASSIPGGSAGPTGPKGSTAATSAPTAVPVALTPAEVPGGTSDGAEPAGSPLVPAEGELADGDAVVLEPPPVLVSDEGFLIAPGSSVHGTGARWRFTVEVEPATGLDVEAVARDVARSLGDERSWSSTRTLERVDDPSAARIRLVVATPETVDRLCAEVGLRTAGIYSCWTGRFAALNAWRWDAGAEGFADIQTYRQYLVNHEFGHGLGYGHVGCPSEGSLAPVMMQQSKGLDGCTANGWPYP